MVVAHVAILGAIAAATWLRVSPWIRALAPLVALWFLYAELPAVIAAAGHVQPFDRVVVEWERALFGVQPSTEWAARWPSRAISELLHVAYIAYYPIIFSVPVVLLMQRRYADLWRSLSILLLTFVVCFATYVVFPVAGPRYLWNSPATDVGGIARGAALFLLESQSSRGTAFPSSHVAVATTQAVIAITMFGRAGIVIAVLAALLGAGAVYGGFHYLVDVLAGAAYGLVLAGAGFAVLRASDRRYAKANAPT